MTRRSLYDITGDIKDINTILINRKELSEMENVLAEAYVVVGALLSDTGLFDTEQGQKILDNLAYGRMVHADILPWGDEQ